MDSLYGRLFRYRTREKRAPLEDYLSEALADLLRRMPRQLVIELISEALRPDQAAAKAWGGWTADGLSFTWHTQEHINDFRKGYIDILLRAEGAPAVVIENKLSSGVRIHAETEAGSSEGERADGNQLSTYGQWLKSNVRGDWSGALILLTHSTSPPADFLDASVNRYGVPIRAVLTWPTLARFLQSRVAIDDGEPDVGGWRILANEFLVFLKEQDMTVETVSGADIAALQVFLPTYKRLVATFQRIWSQTADIRREVCSNKTPTVEFNEEAGVVWGWNYARVPPAPTSSFLAFGFRFPEQSIWWEGAGLPDHPHAFFMVGDDHETLPIEGLSLPAGWAAIETDLVAAKPLHDFRASPDDFVQDLAGWAEQRSYEAVALIQALSGQ